MGQERKDQQDNVKSDSKLGERNAFIFWVDDTIVHMSTKQSP